MVLGVALWTREARWLVAAPHFGYGLARIGHFVFEHNRPATFRHPLYSLAGDFVMFKDMLLGRLPWKAWPGRIAFAQSVKRTPRIPRRSI
jgi:hypothetical protein